VIIAAGGGAIGNTGWGLLIVERSADGAVFDLSHEGVEVARCVLARPVGSSARLPDLAQCAAFQAGAGVWTRRRQPASRTGGKPYPIILQLVVRPRRVRHFVVRPRRVPGAQLQVQLKQQV
jgi:hypothetical protein